jgi:hypothetical protein
VIIGASRHYSNRPIIKKK